MVLAGSGMLLGLLVALAVTRVSSSMLFGIAPHDPLTLGIVVVVLLVTSLAACFVPARRATRVDPLIALRDE